MKKLLLLIIAIFCVSLAATSVLAQYNTDVTVAPAGDAITSQGGSVAPLTYPSGTAKYDFALDDFQYWAFPTRPGAAFAYSPVTQTAGADPLAPNPNVVRVSYDQANNAFAMFRSQAAGAFPGEKANWDAGGTGFLGSTSYPDQGNVVYGTASTIVDADMDNTNNFGAFLATNPSLPGQYIMQTTNNALIEPLGGITPQGGLPNIDAFTTWYDPGEPSGGAQLYLYAANNGAGSLVFYADYYNAGAGTLTGTYSPVATLPWTGGSVDMITAYNLQVSNTIWNVDMIVNVVDNFGDVFAIGFTVAPGNIGGGLAPNLNYIRQIYLGQASPILQEANTQIFIGINDIDGDGATATVETNLGSNDNIVDTDSDGFPDVAELFNPVDLEGLGLYEAEGGALMQGWMGNLDPTNTDTDGDGFDDGNGLAPGDYDPLRSDVTASYDGEEITTTDPGNDIISISNDEVFINEDWEAPPNELSTLTFKEGVWNPDDDTFRYSCWMASGTDQQLRRFIQLENADSSKILVLVEAMESASNLGLNRIYYSTDGGSSYTSIVENGDSQQNIATVAIGDWSITGDADTLTAGDTLTTVTFRNTVASDIYDTQNPMSPSPELSTFYINQQKNPVPNSLNFFFQLQKTIHVSIANNKTNISMGQCTLTGSAGWEFESGTGVQRNITCPNLNEYIVIGNVGWTVNRLQYTALSQTGSIQAGVNLAASYLRFLQHNETAGLGFAGLPTVDTADTGYSFNHISSPIVWMNRTSFPLTVGRCWFPYPTQNEIVMDIIAGATGTLFGIFNDVFTLQIDQEPTPSSCNASTLTGPSGQNYTSPSWNTGANVTIS